MKLSGFIGLILLVSFIFVSWNIILDGFEDNYIDTGISNVSPVSSNYTDKFDGYGKEINDSLYPMIDDFQTLGESDSWFTELTNLAVAIPLTIITFPIKLGAIFLSVLTSIPQFLNLIGIPVEIIYFGGVALIVFFVFKLVEFIRQYNA